MRDKIRRVKQFVDRHNDAYFWTTGVLTGVCFTYLAMRTEHATTVLELSRDHAESILNDATNAVRYDLPGNTILVAVTGA